MIFSFHVPKQGLGLIVVLWGLKRPSYTKSLNISVAENELEDNIRFTIMKTRTGRI